MVEKPRYEEPEERIWRLKANAAAHAGNTEEELQGGERKEVQPIRKGRGHILFVDDEPAVVKFAKPLLEGELEGEYEVEGFTSSIEALEAFRDQPQRFDLVITDMSMPDMTGEELSEELLRIRQDIPIILCTGFSDEVDPEKAGEAGIKEILKKPMLAKDLRGIILRVLDEAK